MSTADQSLRLTGTFEAELLVELMLRFWQHPWAEDREFRNSLLESAAEALRASVAGQILVADVSPPNMNLVAAVWYVEWAAVADATERGTDELQRRQDWLDRLRRAIPSCFCDPDLLP
jgi:hypothetical protein